MKLGVCAALVAAVCLSSCPASCFLHSGSLPAQTGGAHQQCKAVGRRPSALSKLSTRMSGDGKKVPDAITQTDNSAKRQQNAQLRSKISMDFEPEALKQMRLKREAEEAAKAAKAKEDKDKKQAQQEQETEEEDKEEEEQIKAAADAKRRSEAKDFVSGQDVREAKLVEAYQKALKEKKVDPEEAELPPLKDIRVKLKEMQGSLNRKTVQEDSLLHQSEVNSPPLSECQYDVMSYLNRQHAKQLGKFALELNEEIALQAGKANAYMNGAFQIPTARVNAIDARGLVLEANVIETGFFGNEKERVQQVRVDFLDGEECSDADSVKMALIKMMRKCGFYSETASIIEMGGLGSKGWSIPDNLFLNQIPCDPNIREWFYRDACDALQVALDNAAFIESTEGRIRIECVPPEINPEMDTFRVGTMLELVRELSIRVAVVMQKRVKVCIQGSLGEGFFTGVPLMLSGMRKVLEGMDWQSQPGDMYEGILIQDTVNARTGQVFNKGNPDGRVAFGEVGAHEVEDGDEVFIVIAPQSMTGASVYEPLSEMVAAAKGRPFLLINPRLKDKPSSGDNMQVRGRAQRIAFADSFKDIYHFRLLYKGSTFMFPIQGALRYNMANSPVWTVFKRDPTTDNAGMEQESYRPMAVYETEPSPTEITSAIQK